VWMGDFFDIRGLVLSFSAAYTLVSLSTAYTGCIGSGSCRILLVVPISQQVSCRIGTTQRRRWLQESCTRRCVVHVTYPRQ
ncbi:hypothetical protein EDC04DRAFT_2828402, partial [Pisolithus marmoratus]